MHQNDDQNRSGGQGLFARHWSVAEPVPWHDLHWAQGAEADASAPPVTGPLKVLVVDRKGTFSHDIERAARDQVSEPKVILVDHPTQVVEQVVAEAPDVVLVSPEEMTTTGLRRLAQVHRVAPKCVIALTQAAGASPVSMAEATAAGASEVLTYPASTIKLRNALGRILAAAEAAQAERAERVVIKEVVTQVPVSTPLPAGVAHAPVAASAKVYTVTSPTGGCGKTFFATNLAAYLAGATGGRVLLVDLDLQFGEVSLALGLRPNRTISELIAEDNLVESFPDYVVDHSSGYQVLSAPSDPFAAELVGPREATQVLEAARALYDYVVVDTPPSLNEVVLAAFDQSRYLVVMATMDVPSLRNLKVFLETIDRLKLPAEDVSCVLNKAEPDNGIDLDELLRVYPRGFAAVLPYSKEVSRSLNVGKPVLMVDPRAEISQKILESGAKLVPANEIRNPGWMARPTTRPGWTNWRKDRHAPAAAVPVPVPQVPVVTGPAAYPAAAPWGAAPAVHSPAAAAHMAAGRPAVPSIDPALETRRAPASLEPTGTAGYEIVPAAPPAAFPSTPYPPSRTGVLMPPTGGPVVPVGMPPTNRGSYDDKHPTLMDRVRGFFGHKPYTPPPPQMPVSFTHQLAQRPVPPPPAQPSNSYTGPGLSSPLGAARQAPQVPVEKAGAPQKIVFNANRGGGAASFGPPRTRANEQRPNDLRSTSWKEPRR